jgi:hypothetical protein
MLGLNIYCYVEDTDVPFYKTQKSLVKKMDIFDWIPGSYMEDIVEGGESPIDRVRRVNLEEVSMRALVVAPELLVQLHPGTSSRGRMTRWKRKRREKKKRRQRGGGRMGNRIHARIRSPPTEQGHADCNSAKQNGALAHDG